MLDAKKAIRLDVRRRLGELSADCIADASERIVAHVVALAAWREADVIMGFVSLPDEVQTRALLAEALACGKRLMLPRVDWQGRRMFPVEVASLDGLVAGRFGLLEPGGEPANPGDIDLVLVPGLAFDDAGGRLGRGGGFYDRLLADPALDALTVAAAFDCQRVDEPLPRDAHDISIDLLVTESAVTPFTPRGQSAAK